MKLSMQGKTDRNNAKITSIMYKNGLLARGYFGQTFSLCNFTSVFIDSQLLMETSFHETIKTTGFSIYEM